ncbi:Tetratricopeptide repeat protein 29 [Rhizophlyctis rosea]|uniref:Tetratricopeptide repeat protein 29 n=1 Tax=Rhizophlyctis rosea TaxID=64517 RepID=A0AAD5SJD6_9FUNG|nr:Tetratricopeptide repeat protein 29 [Rhizophlyctis rosea]
MTSVLPAIPGAVRSPKPISKVNPPPLPSPRRSLHSTKRTSIEKEHVNSTIGTADRRERMPLTQSIALDLLKEGYVRSYIDFFHMVIQPQQGTLTFDAAMLQDFKLLLTAAEDSQRQGDRKEIYETRKHLAGYFEELNRNDTAVDYYREALDIASKIPEEPSYEVEAARNLGNVLEALNKTEEALTYYERSKLLSSQATNKDSTALASKAIVSVRMRIAEELERTSHLPEAITHYLQCIDIIESGSRDPLLLNDLRYRLGKAYQKSGRVEEAVKYLDTFLEKAREIGDKTKEGWAHAALAACHESLNNLPLAAESLQSFVHLTESDTSQKSSHAQACNQLGMLYNRMGNFEQAVQYFERHYALTREMAGEGDANKSDGEGTEAPSGAKPPMRRGSVGRTSSVGTAQVQLGIARGHALMDRFLSLVKDEKQLPALLKWKATGVMEGDNISNAVSRQNSAV